MVSGMRPGGGGGHDRTMAENTNIQTVQRIYEAFATGDVDAIVELVTDDVDWAAEAAGNGAPWFGVHRGPGEVPHFFKEVGATLTVTEFTPLSFASNDDDVIVVIRFGFTVPATGRSGAMNIHHWWRFRDGKVCMYCGSEDTAQMLECLA
jgi:uncharacterized protein